MYDDSHHHEEYECQECMNIENSSNYISNFDEISFSDNSDNLVMFEYVRFIEFNIEEVYLSRAPPIFK